MCIPQKPFAFSSFLQRFIGAMVLALLFLTFVDVRGQQPDRPEKDLVEAERKYYKGLFDEAADLINSCLNLGGLTVPQQARAYRLFGLIYVSKNELPKAKDYVRKLLEVAPDYEPDPEEEPREFLELVKAVRSEKPIAPVPSTKKGGSKKWLWLGGGGAVAAGAIAFFISRGEERPPRLPDPPALPRK